MAVGADRAAVGRIALAIVRGGRNLVLRPRVAAVMRDRDDERRGDRIRADFLSAERRPANVDGAEERACRGVVGPDLLLVGERGRGLPGDRDRRHPGALVAGRGGRDVVGAGDRDPFEAFECLLRAGRAEVGGQVGVVEPRAVGPRERAVDAPRAERDCRIAVGDQTILEVPGQRSDVTVRNRRTARIGSDHSEAVARRPAAVGRLRPRGAGVEREVDAGDADAGRERTRRVVARVTGFHVDVLVRARDQDVRVIRVHCERRLILLVLRERRYWTTNCDERVGINRPGDRRHDEHDRADREHGAKDVLHFPPFRKSRGEYYGYRTFVRGGSQRRFSFDVDRTACRTPGPDESLSVTGPPCTRTT